MRPTITPERLYNNADMTQVRDLSFLQGCYRLIFLLEEAKKVETAKPYKVPSNQMVWSVDGETYNTGSFLADYTLLKQQNDAQEFWRGIIKMVTRLKDV